MSCVCVCVSFVTADGVVEVSRLSMWEMTTTSSSHSFHSGICSLRLLCLCVSIRLLMLLGCSNLCLHLFGGSGGCGGGLRILGVSWRVVDGFLLDVHANEGKETAKKKTSRSVR